MDLAPPSRPAAGITQAVYPVPRHLKTDLLDQVLLAPEVGSVIVFTRTKHGADRLTRQLQHRGHSVAAIHGDRTQGQRERALGDLRRGRVQVLVATDIAARGIDVKDISHIINYDVPRAPEDYVHRIGRTGRVDATGDAFTLMSPEERADVTAIERFLGHAIPRVVMPDFDYRRAAGQSPRRAARAPVLRAGARPREARCGAQAGDRDLDGRLAAAIPDCGGPGGGRRRPVARAAAAAQRPRPAPAPDVTRAPESARMQTRPSGERSGTVIGSGPAWERRTPWQDARDRRS